MPRRFFREDFDRFRDFVAVRPIQVGGRDIVPGDAIDKSMFTDRRLRQLYDRSMIGYSKDGTSGAGLQPTVLVPVRRGRLTTSPQESLPATADAPARRRLRA